MIEYVYRVYTEVKEFIISCLEFSRDLQLTQTDLDETVRLFLCSFLLEGLSGFNERIRQLYEND